MKLENLDQSNILRNYSPKWLDDDNPWVIDSRSSTTFGGLLINIIFQDLKLSNNFSAHILFKLTIWESGKCYENIFRIENPIADANDFQ